MKLELARRAGEHLLPPNTNTAISADTGEDENVTRTFAQTFHMTGVAKHLSVTVSSKMNMINMAKPLPKVTLAQGRTLGGTLK